MDSQSEPSTMGDSAPDTINIRENTQVFSIDEKPPEDFSVVNSFNNELRNSRSAVLLAKNLWDEKWRTPLEEGLNPQHILFCKDMIIVFGEGKWQLLNMKGETVKSGAAGFSELYIDKINELFYFSDYNGLVQARDLKSGMHKYSLFLMYGADYSRQAFYRRDRLLNILSVEEMEDPHGNHIRNSSVMEVIDIGEPEKIDSNGYLLSAHRINSIPVKSIDVHSAFAGKSTSIASPGQISINDPELMTEKVLTAEFTPLSISMDPDGRMYMAVRAPVNETMQNAFWVLDQDGSRLTNIELPNEVQNFSPPVVGYGSKIFVLSEKHIYSIDIKNNSFIELPFEKPLGGAVISADNKLILAAGRMVYGIDDDGEKLYLTHLDNDRWLTNPVFAGNDVLLCATGKFLYCFARGHKLH